MFLAFTSIDPPQTQTFEPFMAALGVPNGYKWLKPSIPGCLGRHAAAYCPDIDLTNNPGAVRGQKWVEGMVEFHGGNV